MLQYVSADLFPYLIAESLIVRLVLNAVGGQLLLERLFIKYHYYSRTNMLMWLIILLDNFLR